MSLYVLSGLWRRPGRTLGTLFGIAFGMALFIALTAAQTGFREAARSPLVGVGADILLTRPVSSMDAASQTTRGVRQPFGLAPLDLNELENLRSISGVDRVSGGLLLWNFGPDNYQTILGLDAVSSEVGPAQVRRWVVSGRFFEPGERGLLAVDRHYAAFFQLKPRDSVEIGGTTFQVVGIVEVPGGNQAAEANFYMPLADARALAGLNEEQVNQVYVRVAQAADVEAIVAESEQRLGRLTALTEQSIVQVMGGIARVTERFAGLTALAALLGGLFLAFLSMSASLTARTNEIGVMKAVGWQSREVERVILAEGALVSLVGALLGGVLGWLATIALSQVPIEFGKLGMETTPNLGVSTSLSTILLPARITAEAALLALAATMIGGIFAGWLVARQAARRKPAEALRSA
jgi:ABC-type antimicrobial peptide transport system permease subunit